MNAKIAEAIYTPARNIDAPNDSSPPRLKRGSLSLFDIISSTMANIAPAMSFFFSFGVIAAGAGIGAPLTIALAMVAILLLANTVGEFTKHMPSTGSFVSFIGRTFGAAPGVATAIIIIFGYVVAIASVVDILGGWTSDMLQKYLHLNIPWQLLTFVLVAGVLVLMIRGARVSTKWAATFFYLELATLLIVGIVILATNSHYITLRPFNPAMISGGLKGIGVGFPISVFLFIGWENSAMMVEETTNPRLTVPKALFSGVLAMGAIYIFLAYATEVGFHYDINALGSAAVPFIDAAKGIGALVLLCYIAGFTSTFGSLIGAANAQGRIMFSAGREGLLPSGLAKVSKKYQTPWVALLTFLVLAVLIVFVFGFNVKPTNFFGLLATLGGIPVTLIYLVTNIALPVYMYRNHRADFKVARHLIFPILGVFSLALPLWGLIQPGQEYPFNIFPFIALAVIVIAVIWGIVLSKRKPDLAEKVGSIIADH